MTAESALSSIAAALSVDVTHIAKKVKLLDGICDEAAELLRNHTFSPNQLQPNFPLGSALAVSAAFPIGFGPLALRADGYTWKKRAWDAPKGSEQVVEVGTKRLHLYDGGLYDNLGAVLSSGQAATQERRRLHHRQ